MTTVESPSAVDLHSIVNQASPALLLASIVSITGETSRISEFAPYITNSVIDFNPISEMPEDVHSRLVDWAFDVIADLDAYADRDPLTIDDDSFVALASRLIGLPVERDQVAFVREQGGFDTFAPTVPRTKPVPAGFKVLIIGAGMAGIATAVAAHKAGFDFEVLEKNPGVGGVWWQNRYPGVGVDTHSRYYSLSFEINRAWTNSHPQGDEFREYLGDVAEKHGVLAGFTFNAEVKQLVWDDEAGLWHATYVKDGTEHRTSAAAVVTAAGYLTRPMLPNVPGIDSFEGASFHSAEWDDDYDFTDKTVAVIGTGCTSVQIVDSLAPQINSLKLFQRQPHWVFPQAGDSTVPEPERWLLMNVPTYAEWARVMQYIMTGDINYANVRYDAAWAAEHELSISEANDRGLQVALSYLETTFADRPDLLEKMKPNFAFMAKRPIRDPGTYYETLKKDTTEVVASGLVEVRPEGPVDGDGNLHEVDAIVYATGFSLEYLSHWTIIGREGKKLSDVFGDTPMAYLGCQVPGFPNLFITSGPNANPSHGGAHNFCVEAVVHYVIESLQTLIEKDARSIEPTQDAQEAWAREVRERLADSVWVRETRATTYYRNAKGDVLLANPLPMEEYWDRLRQPKLEDMRLA